MKRLSRPLPTVPVKSVPEAWDLIRSFLRASTRHGNLKERLVGLSRTHEIPVCHFKEGYSCPPAENVALVAADLGMPLCCILDRPALDRFMDSQQQAMERAQTAMAAALKPVKETPSWTRRAWQANPEGESGA